MVLSSEAILEIVQKEIPSFWQVFFKLRNVSRAARPALLLVVALILRFFT